MAICFMIGLKVNTIDAEHADSRPLHVPLKNEFTIIDAMAEEISNGTILAVQQISNRVSLPSVEAVRDIALLSLEFRGDTVGTIFSLARPDKLVFSKRLPAHAQTVIL